MALPVIAGGLGLALILKKIAAKAAITAAARTAMAGATLGAGQVIAKTAFGVPKIFGSAAAAKAAGATILHRGAGTIPAAIQRQMLGNIGTLNKTATVGGAIGNAASSILPWGLLAAGRLTQGAATGAGALTAAAGQMPMHLAQTLTSDAQAQRYGETPSRAAAAALNALAGGAGIAVSGLGNAAGSTMSDLGNSLRLSNLHDRLDERKLEQLKQLQGMNITPSEARVFERLQMGGPRNL